MSAKYPARSHALKLVHELVKLIPEADQDKLHGIFLQGSPILYREDTDHELPFHQEANFNYLSGIHHPSCSLAIFFSLSSNPSSVSVIEHHLFIPAADPAETMWSVAPPTLEEARKAYDSDNITYTSSLPGVLRSAVESGNGQIILHTLPRNMEYPACPAPIDDTPGLQLESSYLFTSLHIARLTKDEHEISLIRQANEISSAAHQVVMGELGRFAASRVLGNSTREWKKRTGKESISEWEIESERDAEAVFIASCKRMGATSQAYLPIVASGVRASTLHYVCNDKLFPSLPREQGDVSFAQPLSRGCCDDYSNSPMTTTLHNESFFPQLLLIDAGCEWKGYASDITRVMPVGNGGRFTKEGGEIYELVLVMQKECEALVKPGIHWDTIHLHAHKVLISGLLSLGIVTGTPEEILRSGITAAFFPHGLGHSLGLDTHDSLQYLRQTHIDIPETSFISPKLYKYLRIRQPLQVNMVLTVEPGCYFAPQLMQEHGVWTSPYVVKAKLKEYVGIGGVRIEDVIIVRETGAENLTTVGKERAWVESICSDGLA
ncbi:uncharacterized protein L203_102005 [Cryptococcus depauperatus CBS 7841]|uniref:Uncharacterized protein n=1 Tax=Cryptococcus depauperatus CBS 7841 TaxID=1295531 RepID=A0A1E3IRI4_9TREE|nr:xaa-Pro dipeptidase [Cryptococcus depauperatus CBS 7841]